MSPMKPETLKLVNWVKDWLIEKGYQIQPRIPWKHDAPTVVYGLDKSERPIFAVLAHLITLEQMVHRLGKLMRTNPRPANVCVVLPRNAPHEIEVELKGRFTYGIHVVEGPDYPYPSKYFENEVWGSTFSISLCKRGSKTKE